MVIVQEIIAEKDQKYDSNAQQSFYALQFPAKYGAQVNKYLSKHYGTLNDINYGHLKRVKKHTTLPQTLLALILPCIQENRNRNWNDIEEEFDGKVVILDVLQHPPNTREIWEKHTNNWPLIFHTIDTSTLIDNSLAPYEVTRMLSYLQRAIYWGTIYRRQNTNSSMSHSCADGCIIVSNDIDSLSFQDHIVAESVISSDLKEYVYMELFHPIMIAIEKVGKRDKVREDGERVDKPSKKMRVDRTEYKEEEENNEEYQMLEHDSYLCTEYDIYVDREPCAMCAMALVHSRAKRVIFAQLNPTDGALASNLKLHTLPSLNHRYRVFHFQLSEQ